MSAWEVNAIEAQAQASLRKEGGGREGGREGGRYL